MNEERIKERLIEVEFEVEYGKFSVLPLGTPESFRAYVRSYIESKYALVLDDDLRLALRDKQNHHLLAFDEDGKELNLTRVLLRVLDKYLRRQ